jgi:hypothetical protein
MILLLKLTVNFTVPKPISKLANKCLLKFSAFLNLANIRSHTKFQKNKTWSDLVVKISSVA